MQPLHSPWPLGAPVGNDAVFVTAVEEHLQPDTDPEHRAPTGESTTDQLGTAHRTQAGHAGGKRADARDDQTVSLRPDAGIVAQGHLGAGARESALHGADVAGAVIENDDSGPGHPVRLLCDRVIQRPSSTAALGQQLGRPSSGAGGDSSC